MNHKESVSGIFRIVLGVSFLCSVLVSSSAVLLRDFQIANQELDRKRNVLKAAGIYTKGMSEGEIRAKYSQIQSIVVDFQTGEIAKGINSDTYNMEKEARDLDFSIPIPTDKDIAKLRRISRYGILYLYRKEHLVERIILPIYGPGLWSTMYGFLSLEKDGKTIAGISFYEHGETPGLGGEIENPRWQALWVGKSLLDSDGNSRIEVVRGEVDKSKPGSETRVDGISGATITGRAVGNIVRFWVGDFAYGKVLKNLSFVGGEHE